MMWIWMWCLQCVCDGCCLHIHRQRCSRVLVRTHMPSPVHGTGHGRMRGAWWGVYINPSSLLTLLPSFLSLHRNSKSKVSPPFPKTNRKPQYECGRFLLLLSISLKITVLTVFLKGYASGHKYHKAYKRCTQTIQFLSNCRRQSLCGSDFSTIVQLTRPEPKATASKR